MRRARAGVIGPRPRRTFSPACSAAAPALRAARPARFVTLARGLRRDGADLARHRRVHGGTRRGAHRRARPASPRSSAPPRQPRMLRDRARAHPAVRGASLGPGRRRRSRSPLIVALRRGGEGGDCAGQPACEGGGPGGGAPELSVAVTTLGPVTATANHVPARAPGAGPAGVVLDASATTHCRRRIHLDHDPSAVAAPRALPDPSSAQRRADAAEHRVRIGALLAARGRRGVARGAGGRAGPGRRHRGRGRRRARR